MVGDQNGVASIVVAGKEEHKYKAAATLEGINYYGLCILGGMLSAGITHIAITPLDVVKVNMQLSPIKYPSIYTCFSSLLREQGPCTFWRGWGSKFFGYGLQGGCRFGLYEYFKSLYSDLIPAEYQRNRSVVFVTSSATAELFANLCLCPFEAIKVKVQAQPPFAKGLHDGFPKLYASNGLLGFYRGLAPLMGRNIPFSMVMFSTFEHSVDILYRKVMKARKEECSKGWQLGVTCMAGYAAGSVGSLVSNPADNLVTHLYNNNKTDGLIMAVKKIGCLNLFTRSLPIRVILVGPAVTLQWLLFDTIKVLSGLPTSGEVKTDTS
ncbi:Mitochondrial phosphate carrier protein 1, mitochondrial [Linum grandiflorum]